jgi:hypothetical protein
MFEDDVFMVEGAEMTGFWGVLLCGLVIGTNISEEPPAW